MKKKNLFAIIILSMLLVGCNHSSSLENDVVSDYTQDKVYENTYLYDEGFHWKNKEDKKSDTSYDSHHYVEGKCEVCGYIEDSHTYLEFETIDDKTCRVVKGNEKVREISIPYYYENRYVVEIAERAFFRCFSLNYVILPRSIRTIGNSAFQGCYIVEMFIPENVMNMGAMVFEGNNNMILFMEAKSRPEGWKENWKARVPLEIWGYKGKQGVYNGLRFAVSELETGKEACIIKSDNSHTSLVIPNTINKAKVTKIAQFSFYECKLLEEIVVSNEVLTIADLAFGECTSLKKVTLSKNLKSIGYGAFSGCKSLESIFIPISVTEMDEQVFSFCESLTIYCEAEKEPEGWKDGWNNFSLPVYWGSSSSLEK